jgi:tetratricopeptide (TPR) repeat protein
MHEGQAGDAGVNHSAEAHSDRLSIVVAVIIALATLVAAITGYLQENASVAASDTRSAAEAHSLAAFASAQSSASRAQVAYEAYGRWVEQQTAATSALLAGLYAGDDEARSRALDLERERWLTAAEATRRLTDIDLESEFGPERDPTFPARYFAAAEQESFRLGALQDAADERATQNDERAATYTAALAMLAVALYLFGLTLAVRAAWLRRGFFAVGLVLLMTGGGWAAATATLPPPASDDAAATAYARARVASNTAYDEAGYRAAEQLYDEAIRLRPTFARAYAERAGSIILGATPQRSGLISLVPTDALRRARVDLEQARSLGLANAQTHASLGFYAFVEGLQSDDDALLGQSAEFSRQAIARDPREPVYRYNLGVALAALSRFDEARAAYDEAVARTLYVDEARTELRAEPYGEEAWLGGALTDLELVVRYRPALADGLRELKEQLVGRIAGQSLDQPAPSPASVGEVEVNVFPAEVQWQAPIADYDPARDVVSTQWYQQDESGLGWAVLPEVSGVDAPATGTDGRLFRLAPYLDAVYPPSCLKPATYRVELYVNGRLAGQGEATAEFADYSAFMARELTFAFCRPAEWQRREDRLPGLIDGYRSADGERGAYVARWGLPGSLLQTEDIVSSWADLTIDSFTDWFPAEPSFSEDLGTSDAYFVGLADRTWRWYDYGTGYVRLAAGLTDDGAVLVGMVFGPYDWFDGSEPYRILDSMIHRE